MKRTTSFLSLAILLAAAAACGGGQENTPPATPPPPPAETSPPPVTPPPAETAAPAPPTPPPPAAPPGPGDWDKWTHDQKLAYMKAAVMPKMKDLFGGFDAAKFGDMKCATCHGPAATADGSFKMPNPGLPKLPMDPKGFKALQAQQPKMFDFMMKHVEPDVAALIGEPAFDPKTMKGFGCFNCHTKK